MDELKVFWTQTAKRQRDYIFDYWNTRNKSKSYSKKLNLAIIKKIQLLKFHPEMGKTTNFGSTRAISMRHYSILYKTDNSRLIITGFWDNRQNPAKLLKFLKK